MQARLGAANNKNNTADGVDSQKQFPVALALREAGFIPLPRLWVKAEDIPRIHEIADQYGPEIHEIRAEVYARNQKLTKLSRTETRKPKAHRQVSNPMTDRDAAWELFEKMRATK